MILQIWMLVVGSTLAAGAQDLPQYRGKPLRAGVVDEVPAFPSVHRTIRSTNPKHEGPAFAGDIQKTNSLVRTAGEKSSKMQRMPHVRRKAMSDESIYINAEGQPKFSGGSSLREEDAVIPSEALQVEHGVESSRLYSGSSSQPGVSSLAAEQGIRLAAGQSPDATVNPAPAPAPPPSQKREKGSVMKIALPVGVVVVIFAVLYWMFNTIYQRSQEAQQRVTENFGRAERAQTMKMDNDRVALQSSMRSMVLARTQGPEPQTESDEASGSGSCPPHSSASGNGSSSCSKVRFAVPSASRSASPPDRFRPPSPRPAEIDPISPRLQNPPRMSSEIQFDPFLQSTGAQVDPFSTGRDSGIEQPIIKSSSKEEVVHATSSMDGAAPERSSQNSSKTDEEHAVIIAALEEKAGISAVSVEDVKLAAIAPRPKDKAVVNPGSPGSSKKRTPPVHGRVGRGSPSSPKKRISKDGHRSNSPRPGGSPGSPRPGHRSNSERPGHGSHSPRPGHRSNSPRPGGARSADPASEDLKGAVPRRGGASPGDRKTASRHGGSRDTTPRPVGKSRDPVSPKNVKSASRHGANGSASPKPVGKASDKGSEESTSIRSAKPKQENSRLTVPDSRGTGDSTGRSSSSGHSSAKSGHSRPWVKKGSESHSAERGKNGSSAMAPILSEVH